MAASDLDEIIFFPTKFLLNNDAPIAFDILPPKLADLHTRGKTFSGSGEPDMQVDFKVPR
jgi:hypothetical protein